MKNNFEDYCIDKSYPENDLLNKIKKFTFDTEPAPQMISGPIVCNTLLMFIKMINAKKILEVGMFTGYSALYMAQGLDRDGEIHTCEYMEEHIYTANNFFSKSKYKDMINIHSGLALETLENFKINSFDFAFIDADKINYLNYYLRCMRLVKSNGIIVLDNMLWSGEVINPKDDDSKKLRETGDYIQNDKRVINMLLPIRDGLMVCIKK